MRAVHLDLDGAWEKDVLGLPVVDAASWGPRRLRYIASGRNIETFAREVGPQLAPFVLYGSGDFHHLSAVLVQRVAEDVTIVCFDNHPDWDVRPPKWGCGGWISRALRVAHVRRASVWGCGNFELAFPSRLFADAKSLRAGRLELRPWAERQPASVQRRFNCIRRDDWRGQFEQFAKSLAGQAVYVSVDLDCLDAAEAVTNWENGLFTADDIGWAIEQIRGQARLVGGDVCGAWSEPSYAYAIQRLAGWWDHPKLPPKPPQTSRQINRVAIDRIWPSLANDR